MLTVTIESDDSRSSRVVVEHFPCRIGKGRDNEVTLPSWRAARVHAEIHRIERGFKLVDGGSILGTWVNGERVVEYGPLNPSDEIVIAGFRLHIEPPLLPGLRERPGPSDRSEGGQLADLDTAAVASIEANATVESSIAWRRTMHRKLLHAIDLRRKDVRQLTESQLREEARRLLVELLAAEQGIPEGIDLETLIVDILDEAIGLGPLEKLMADVDVSEIMVNGAQDIFVERHGRLERSRVAFTSDEAIRAVIDRIVAPIGRRIDEASPMVDARLADGSRVNAIVPPLSIKGPTITIRRFNRRLLRPADLIGLGTASAQMIEFIAVCVTHRKNIVISGGTGSGKTTLLNVVSNLIPAGERVVTIEDAAELRLNHENLVSLESRPSNAEGRGAITIRDLVRNALRMRPDRIVVGEVRGGEALDMLQAMNTGHDGSLTTLHANSPRDVISRLETMVLMSGVDLPVMAIRDQIASAVDVIVHQSRLADGSRRITEIVEVTGVEAQRVQMQTLFRWSRTSHREWRFGSCGVVPQFYEQLAGGDVGVDIGIFDDAGRGRSMTPGESLLAIEIAVFVAVAVLGWWIWHRLGHASQRYGERFNESVEVQLERAYLFIDPRRLLTLNALVVIVASGLAFAISGNLLMAVAAALVAGSAPRLVLASMKRTRRERFRQQLPDLMLLTGGGLRAGGSLWQALAQTSAEMAAPARQEIEMMLREQRLGVAMEHALAGLERRMNVEEMRLFGAAIRIAHETGGNLAETLEGLAESTRRKQALEGKVRALTSQGRLQGWVMGLLPMALGLILFQIEPRAMSALFTTWYGGCVCVAIVVLQVLGFHFVRRIVTVDV